MDKSDVCKYPRTIRGYSFVKVLGKGGFGVVTLYENGDQVAIKLESTKSQNQSSTKEAILLRKLNEIEERITPRYINHGLANVEETNESFNFIIMEYLP